MEMNGIARIGIDDFVRKILKQIDKVDLPKPNKEVKKGDLLFSIKHNAQTIEIASPLSGKVTLVNKEHLEHPDLIALSPFELSWMCCIDPSNLAEELQSLKIGADTINWYREEIDKYVEIAKGIEQQGAQAASAGKGADKAAEQKADEKLVEAFANTFLRRQPTA